MQGKTVNTNFVNDFIIQCATQDKTSPQEVCREARRKLTDITNELDSLARLKETKNSLLDVLSIFGDNKYSKKKDREQLSFFTIKSKHTAYSLCSQLINQSIKIENMSDIIEELQSLEIIRNVNGYLTQNRNFELFFFHFMKKYYGL